MAPRKINSKVSNVTPQYRNTRGRSKKNRSPISIEIQIPAEQSVEITEKNSQKQMTRRRTKKSSLSLERQIELANEVIHTQLTRRIEIKSNPNLTERIPSTAIDMSVPNDINEVDIKAPVRKMIRNRPINKTETIEKPQMTRKRSADSTQEIAKQRKISSKTTTADKPKTKSNTATKGNTQKKKTIQGKKKINDVNAVQNYLPTLEAIENTDVKEPTAAVIDSRKSSSTSASNFSWTKDISSSSTTTCITVSTNDFVRIDNKIPIIQLTNVDNELQKYKRCESDDSSSDSDSSSELDSVSNVTIDVEDIELNLSTSSTSICKGNSNCTPKSESMKGGITMSKALFKLSSILKNFDKEIVKWIGYGEDIDDANKKCNDTILRVLNEESLVISSCRQLIRIFSDKESDDVDTDGEFKPAVTNSFNVSFDDDNPITKENVLLNENVEYPRSPKSPSTTFDSDYAFDNFNNMSFDRNNDDDDALSLFAESITGIEPCKTDNPSESPGLDDLEHDEYVPQFMNEDLNGKTEKYEYSPTKISNSNAAVKKNVCEKQNADSTSISKEGNVENMPHGEVERASSEAECNEQLEESKLAVTEVLPNQIGPPQVTSIFQQVPWKRTKIFRDMCFFNLMNACKRKHQYCSYPHVVPNEVEIRTRLIRLSETAFIEEYIFMSSHSILRRVYGLYFVEECHRRGMTRTLVEMALDFVANFVVKNKEDAEYQLSILEYILLALNDVGLVVCEDLLDSPVDGDKRLCHLLMRVIANSLNFSRFKQVFFNLTNVMVRYKRTFDLDISEQILERVCILPAEERLLRAVFDIIKRTDACIFANSMMCIFEMRLKTINSAMYEEFTEFKNGKTKTSGASKPLSITLSKGRDLEPLKISCINDNERESYTSPDTTKADNLQKKPALDISSTRTVHLRRTCYNNKFSSTPTAHNVDNWLQNDFHSWTQRSPRAAPVPLLSLPIMRPTMPLDIRKVKMHRKPPTIYRPRPPRNF